MKNTQEKLSTLLSEIDACKAELDALLPMRQEGEKRLWDRLRLEWNYNSNHIEGNTLTYMETKLLLFNDFSPEGVHDMREIDEMRAHDMAISMVRGWAGDSGREITETDIRDLNRVLLVKPFWKDAITPDGQDTRRLISIGEYKSEPNSVQLASGEMFHYTAPGDVAREMGELMDWYRTNALATHPLVVAAMLHYRLVRIHPFDDGNGRVSRLVMNFHLLRNGLPPVVIKSEDKKNYLIALQRADAGDYGAFAEYIGEQLIWTLNLSITAGKRESVEEAGDWEKKVELLKRKAEVIDQSERQRRLNESQRKLNLVKTIEKWLETNLPILRSEMEIRIGVFDNFFHTHVFQAYYKVATGRIQELFTPKTTWSATANQIVSRRISSIILRYQSHNPKLLITKSFQIPPKAEIVLNFSDGIVTIGSSWNDSLKIKKTVDENLSESDLQPIKNLGDMYYETIEAALKIDEI